MHRRRFLHLSVVAGAALVTGCGGAPNRPAVRGTEGVLEVARANGADTFLRSVEAAGMVENLSGSGPYTLFVPTDAAFRALPPGELARLMRPENREALRGLLGYHVVPGMVSSSFMTGLEMNHLTASGETLAVDGSASPIRVNSARVTRADLGASNGVVHIVDRVLAPA